MKKLIITFAALLNAACGRNNVFTVDENFTAEEREDIRRAGIDWQIATKERFDFEFGPVSGEKNSLRNEIIRTESISFWVWREGADIDGGIGFCDKDGPANRIIMIVDRIQGHAEFLGLDYRVVFRRVIRHEMGHHFNAKHITVPGSIMTQGAIGPECIDSATVDSYCEHNTGCDRSQMRGCQQQEP